MNASRVNVLAIDPANHAILYLGTNSGMFKSNNSAATWNPINTCLPSSPTIVNAIAINPLNSSTVYAGTGSGLYKSTTAALHGAHPEPASPR